MNIQNGSYLQTNELANIDQLSKEAHHYHAEAQRVAQTIIKDMQAYVQNCAESGKRLIQIKAALKHGEWEPWVKAHCLIPPREVRRHMQWAKELPKLDETKTATVADLGLRKGLAYLSNQREKEQAETEKKHSLEHPKDTAPTPVQDKPQRIDLANKILPLSAFADEYPEEYREFQSVQEECGYTHAKIKFEDFVGSAWVVIWKLYDKDGKEDEIIYVDGWEYDEEREIELIKIFCGIEE